ncbi:hypothetical protein [Saccharopolyspora sp. NPDC002376]
MTRATCPPAELDEHGRVRNAEESIGEIVNTEGTAKFEGYYENPAANAERVRHGWYWTGDLDLREQFARERQAALPPLAGAA